MTSRTKTKANAAALRIKLAIMIFLVFEIFIWKDGRERKDKKLINNCKQRETFINYVIIRTSPPENDRIIYELPHHKTKKKNNKKTTTEKVENKKQPLNYKNNKKLNIQN